MLFWIVFSLIRSFVFGFAGHSNAWFGVLECPFFVASFGLLLYGLHKISDKFSFAGVLISLLNAVFLFINNVSLYESGWIFLI
ncbi:hypothetical protein [Bacillus toyonensis]|uniref:Uncharacterized protein n=1 Tax=Bacillus toyonensis TaxID=155322 RepID=A0A2A8H7U9_9BACI|nr:hypothetical protein [Bacillus toyonensis]PEP91629.1 hypothetical protein CN585_27800 [Bacillus toyonensis]